MILSPPSDRLTFKSLTADDYPLFHRLLCAYYREGEDADTGQAQLDEFIRYLFDLCLTNRISGALAVQDVPVGFVLWMIDDGSVFSNLPDYGTILEIGVVEQYRKIGLGRKLADYAEGQIISCGTSKLYVCAYGPAVGFWMGCGYRDTGKTAENGLPILTKTVM